MQDVLKLPGGGATGGWEQLQDLSATSRVGPRACSVGFCCAGPTRSGSRLGPRLARLLPAFLKHPDLGM